MRDHELEQRLREAADHAAPNDLEAILTAPRRAQPEEEILPMRRSRPRWLPMAAAAMLAVLAFCGFQTWRNGHMVASVVSLDVNPSIQLQVSRREQVLSADPLNKEAWEVLEGMDLKGAQLNVAVNAIIGSLLQRGYFEEAGAAILISVEDRDAQRAQRLESSLNASVGAALENAVVHSQVVTYDAGTEPPANGVSAGKAALIRDIQGLNSALDFEGLSALSVEELWQLRQAGAPGMPIGLGNAAGAAERCAGTLELNSSTWEGEPELDEAPAHYEIELSVYGGEESVYTYDYKVDAYTGEILEGTPNVLSAQPPAVPAAPPSYSDASQAPGGTPSAVPAAPAGPSYISAEDAKAAAYAHAGVQAADVYGLELELDDGVYELEFCAGSVEYEYEISALDGTVLKAGADRDAPASGGHHGDAHHSAHSTTCITEDAACTAAFHHAGVSADSASGYRCRADWDDGQCVYEIEFRCGGVQYEYAIDGRTGTVLKAEQDR